MQDNYAERLHTPKFLLLSSLAPVEEVLVVQNPRTQPFVEALERIVPLTGAKLSPIPFDTVRYDVWMQDSVEIGQTCVISDGELKQELTVLSGLRAKHEPSNPIHSALDSCVRDYFVNRKAQVVDAGEAREGSRWMDWFGNLEVSPPLLDAQGQSYPFGRALVGVQKGVTMHPGVLQFLEAQGLQVPPVFVDTSWLVIGHVDEVVNFVPSAGACGFKVLLPSPRLALDILVEVTHGENAEQFAFAGRKSQRTLRQLRDEVALSAENRDIETAVQDTRQQLMDTLGITAFDFVEIPVLFQDGISLVPNGVNSLVCNNHIIVPHPNVFEVNGEDCFARSIRQRLEPLGLTVHFVDIWDSYHVSLGEVHCGTNAIRKL